MLTFERRARTKGFSIIIGVDEAGRGPLAGPVVASAVWLGAHRFRSIIRDSKQMTPHQRQIAYEEILQHAQIGIGIVDAATIDKINILQGTFQAMTQAVQDLLSKISPESKNLSKMARSICLLIDGNRFATSLPFLYETIVKGDAKSLSIACASIVAKVVRDRIMDDYDTIYPGYGFAKHKGYPTVFHRQQIRRLGYSAIHRKTFQCEISA